MRKKTIVIVLDEAEKKQIQGYAHDDHMEVSPWCRMQIQRAIDRIEDQKEARRARLKLLGSRERVREANLNSGMRGTSGMRGMRDTWCEDEKP